MKLFNFFSRDKYRPDLTGPTMQPTANLVDQKALPDIEEHIFIENAPPIVSKTPAHFAADHQSTIMETPNTTVSDNNIGLLYAFLDRNHEAKGYDDALLNPDASHLSQNLDALKNDLVRTLNKVKTFYEDFIQETDYHIISRGRSGMVDIVEELEMKRKIASGHMLKVKEIEANTEKEAGDCKGILISYTRGFKNGLAAISHHNILTRKF